MAINSGILAEMDIPDTYIESLPKVSPSFLAKSLALTVERYWLQNLTICPMQIQSGRASVGDIIYRYMCSTDKFSPDHVLDCLNIASEHEALELADRVEASMYTWRRKACMKNSKSSWEMVKDLMSDMDRTDKNHALAERAESLLFCLKRKYPELSQTSLDTCKIQYNRVSKNDISFLNCCASVMNLNNERWILQDVGQAILESYSRVLEGLAFNIVAWIEDVLFVDQSVRSRGQ